MAHSARILSPFTWLLAFAGSAFLLPACGPDGDDTHGSTGGVLIGTGGAGTGGVVTPTGGAGTGGAVTGPSACGDTASPFVIAADGAHNLQFSSVLTIAPHVLQGSSLDVSFDWSGVTTDFYGHAVAPGDIKAVFVVPMRLTLTQIQEYLNADDTAAINGAAELPIRAPLGVTSAKFSEFTDVGFTAIPPDDVIAQLDPAKGFSYLFIAQDKDTQIPGDGVRMMYGFTVAAAGETAAVVDNNSTLLTVDPKLSTTLHEVPAGSGDIQIDWTSGLATNAAGHEFKPDQITEVIVGQYSADLNFNGPDFLDLEEPGTYKKLWRGQVIAGSTFNLKDLTDEGGAAFAGIDASGDQWLVGLLCRTENCKNPTPWYLGTLKACP